jgi:hypothetical protein
MTFDSQPTRPGKLGAQPSRDRRFVSLNPFVDTAKLQTTTTGRRIRTTSVHRRAELSTMSAPTLTLDATSVSARLRGRDRRFWPSPYNYYCSF